MVVALELWVFEAPPAEVLDAPAMPVVSVALAVTPLPFAPPSLLEEAALDTPPLDTPPLTDVSAPVLAAAVSLAPNAVVTAPWVVGVELDVVPTA